MTTRSIKDKRTAYINTFKNEAGKEVLADLRGFCFGTKTSFDSDPLIMARNEGRREVFLQIMNIMKVDFEEYYNHDPVDYL